MEKEGFFQCSSPRSVDRSWWSKRSLFTKEDQECIEPKNVINVFLKQQHFQPSFLETSYAMVLKKKKAFCSAKFPTILISLSFEPFNWQCQMQFVFCSKANALKWLSQYEPWQSLILLGLKGRLTTEYCSHMPSEFHDTMLPLLCKG